jgi:hypothetical protein
VYDIESNLEIKDIKYVYDIESNLEIKDTEGNLKMYPLSAIYIHVKIICTIKNWGKWDSDLLYSSAI